jgi:hypothetical protein
MELGNDGGPEGRASITISTILLIAKERLIADRYLNVNLDVDCENLSSLQAHDQEPVSCYSAKKGAGSGCATDEEGRTNAGGTASVI